MSGFSLADLERIVAQRAAASPEESWTAKLVAGGQKKAAKKFGEEAVEAVIAAISDDRKNLTDEAADVIFHLFVMLKISGIPFSDVLAELEQRTAQSGIAEKAARKG